MLWAILIIGLISALAAIGAENNTRNLKAMILILGRDKADLMAMLEANRSQVDELRAEVFELKMEVRGARR